MVANRPVRGTPAPYGECSAAQAGAHIDRQIPPLAHTPMYVWHKFWGRKTWNVVAEYIRTYCPEGGVVFDPFAGSGVVAIEALKAGRKAIVCDLLPIATEITRLTIRPVDVDDLRRAFERVAARVKDRILGLYETRCRKCGHKFAFTCAVWEKDQCVEIRYESCPSCGDRRERNCRPSRADLALLREIESRPIRSWYPRNRLYYPDGTPFMKKERYESLDQMFTKRNLMALAWLIAAIEKEPRRDLRDFLKIAFTSMVHLCTNMCVISEAGHFTPFSSAWVQHSYWRAPSHMEQNVWEKFESAVVGHQGLFKAKEESGKFFSKIRLSRRVEQVLAGPAGVYLHCGDATDLMRRIVERRGPCVDYIFTDPPYDAAVQYGELAYLWVAWLKKDQSYLDRILTKEIIRNERQHKTFDVYHGLLGEAFRLMHDILKPGGYLTVTFHNPTFKVRNATINAGVTAGFDLEKIHHQELARPSAKSLLQPFGSAQGDFYLRFRKPVSRAVVTGPERIDAERFERIVLEAAKRVVAERGEPTPYTILLNAIDPELAHKGYFSQLRTGLDVRTVLENHLGQEFVLVPMHLGGAEGKAWWFRDPRGVPHLETVPLSERVEQTVLRKLQAHSRVTFTDMWKAVSEEFPNALTTDSTSIKEALQSYARPIARGGEWMLKPDYSREKIRRVHTLMIAILAEVGKALGHDIWIGRREQGDSLGEAFPGREGELRQFVSRPSLEGLQNANNIDEVENIDVLWLRGNRVEAVFEVEATTSMTEALKRGSNVGQAVAKYLVIPQDREGDLRRKQRSPLFEERFRNDCWNPVFCERLQKELSRLKTGDVGVEQLIAKTIANPSKRPSRSHEQLDMLGATAGD